MSKDRDMKALEEQLRGAKQEDKVGIAVTAVVKSAWLEERRFRCKDPEKPLRAEVERRGENTSILTNCGAGTFTETRLALAEEVALHLEASLEGGIHQIHLLAHVLVSLLVHEEARGKALVLPFGAPPFTLRLVDALDGTVSLEVGRLRDEATK